MREALWVWVWECVCGGGGDLGWFNCRKYSSDRELFHLTCLRDEFFEDGLVNHKLPFQVSVSWSCFMPWWRVTMERKKEQGSSSEDDLKPSAAPQGKFRLHPTGVKAAELALWRTLEQAL